MDVEKTIRYLVENAAAHDARLVEMEKNSVLIQNALLRLVEHDIKLAEHQVELGASVGELRISMQELRTSVQETQRALRELGEKTDQRIAALVSAIARLAERDANGPGRR